MPTERQRIQGNPPLDAVPNDGATISSLERERRKILYNLPPDMLAATGTWTSTQEECRRVGLYDLSPEQQVATTVAPVEPVRTPARILESGGWTWFSDPRSIVANGNLYVGTIDQINGGDALSQQINLTTGVQSIYNLASNFEPDDHDEPVFFEGLTGKVTAIYEKHGVAGELHHLRTQTVAGDNSAYDVARDGPPAAQVSYVAYGNVFRLSAESNRLYMFYRTKLLVPRDPHLSYSDDDGVTWSVPVSLFEAPLDGPGGSNARPYMKYASNGVDRIDFWTSEGHPRDYTPCNLYHFYYKGGNYYKSDGTLIHSIATRVLRSEATKVHDATATGFPGWTWSIVYDTGGAPVVSYAVFNTGDDHRYWYGRWTGVAWETHEVCTGGLSLYGTTGSAEPQYSGGVMVDPVDTRIVWACRQPTTDAPHELERYTTLDGGNSWDRESITTGSVHKNFRPFVPMPQSAGVPRVIWLQGSYEGWLDWNARVMGLVALDSPLIPADLGALSDTFTDGDKLVTSHRSDSGHIWSRHPTVNQTIRPAPAIKTNTLRGGTGASSMAICDKYTTAAVTMSGAISSVTDDNANALGPCWYMDPIQNTCLHLRFHNNGNKWELVRYVNNTGTVLQTLNGVVDTFVVTADAAGVSIQIGAVPDAITEVAANYTGVPQAGYIGVRNTGAVTDATGLRLDSLAVA